MCVIVVQEYLQGVPVEYSWHYSLDLHQVSQRHPAELHLSDHCLLIVLNLHLFDVYL